MFALVIMQPLYFILVSQISIAQFMPVMCPFRIVTKGYLKEIEKPDIFIVHILFYSTQHFPFLNALLIGIQKTLSYLGRLAK